MKSNFLGFHFLMKPISGSSLGLFRWALLPAIGYQMQLLSQGLARSYSSHPQFFSEFRLPLGIPESSFLSSEAFFGFNLLLALVFGILGLCFCLGWGVRRSAVG